MHKGWRFVFCLAVGVIGAAIWVSWWATLGFPSPICPDAGAADHCLSRDKYRRLDQSDLRLHLECRRIRKSLGDADCGALDGPLSHFHLAPMAVHPEALERH